MTIRKIKVFILDDQAVVRKILSKTLPETGIIDVVGASEDPVAAFGMIAELKPDVLTLDVEMPRMNGIDFLKKLMKETPMPVIMLSSLTQEGQNVTLEALDAGAIDFVSKPDGRAGGLGDMMEELIKKIKIAHMAGVRTRLQRLGNEAAPILSGERKKEEDASVSSSAIKVIAIGASTGGTTVIRDMLSSFPEKFPPVVIVQHMPPGFTRIFAERLNAHCRIRVKEAENGESLEPGTAYIAPGDRHLKVTRSRFKRNFLVELSSDEKVSGHRPSVDVMFESVSENFEGSASVGVLLTGMGKDGAQGLLKLKQNGAVTFAQDKESSVVFGMPDEADKLGAVDYLLPPEIISERVIKMVRISRKKPAG